MIEINSIREKDVLEGRVSLAEFTKKGKTEKQIYDEMVKQTIKEMGKSLQAIRSKRLSILVLGKLLLECQTRIRYLIIEPGRILQKVLKDLAQFAEREIGLFLEEVHSSKTALEQVKNKLLLTEGKSLTPGYMWNQLTVEEASRVQFDPILPRDLVPKLKVELERFKDAETVNISFWLKSWTVEVTSFTRR